MDRAKKLAAAMAAVSAYIKAEEEQAAAEAVRSSRSPTWSMFGRQAQAQQCSLMQAIVRR